MQDTSPEAQRRYYALLQAKSPAERLQIALRLTRAVRDLAAAGVRAQNPSASEREVRAGLTERLYGREVAARLFPNHERDGQRR